MSANEITGDLIYSKPSDTYEDNFDLIFRKPDHCYWCEGSATPESLVQYKGRWYHPECLADLKARE